MAKINDVYDIGAAFEAIEDELTASMIRNMKRHKAEETKEGFEWAQWQAEQLRFLEEYKKKNQKKYGKKFKSINSKLDALIRAGRDEGGMQQEIQILNAIGARFERDIRPGEIVVADKNGVKSIETHCGRAPKRLCVFEFIYFARPDSVIDGSSVHVARQRAGAFLALEHPVQADIVVGVPDSGLDAALGYARQSGIPYGMGFIKNKYIGRTFISPTQAMRENEVNIKLNPIRSVVEGKRVVLIDDSIVRGTTCRRTIQLLREAGAREIHMRVSAPPFVAACYYGTDIDDPGKLIANHHTVEEIAQIIGVDSLGYLSIQDVVKLADNTECGFCTACFGGGYPTAVPKNGRKDRFACKISEREKG